MPVTPELLEQFGITIEQLRRLLPIVEQRLEATASSLQTTGITLKRLLDLVDAMTAQPEEAMPDAAHPETPE